MLSNLKTWTLAIVLSYAALLAALARTFLDYQYVYRELGFNVITSGMATLVNLALFGGWIYALYTTTRSSRRGIIATLAFNTLMLIFSISTVVSLCPSPCPTGWPVGEIIIWSNVLIGVPAVIITALAVYHPTFTDREPNPRAELRA
jgi:hypothetical protein